MIESEQAYAKLYLKKKLESYEKYKQYPVLYWAKRFHRNTRDEVMSFKDMYYLLDIYKIAHQLQYLVVKKSVQCGISEFLIIESHSLAQDGLTVFYVLPKYEIRNRFVNNRIHRLHKRVGYYANLVREARVEGGAHRTSLMHFGKGTIAYVGSNVEDEFIEIPVDVSYVDEKDRCNQANLLLVPDRLTASPYKVQREVSNPTVEDFGIDERYQSSTQGQWALKCDACGKYFIPNFFEHVVREIDHNRYVARDPEYVPFETEARLIHTCGAPVDRLKRGEWVHQYPDRQWVGFHISKIFNKFQSLAWLVEEWNKAVGHDLKTQVFYNSNLGLAYSSEGAKIHEHNLEECKRDYQYPAVLSRARSPRSMGVDVGSVLNVVIRERVNDAGIIARRLLLAKTVESFAELGALIRDWQPKAIVVDALPEIHEVSRLKVAFSRSNIWSSEFQEGKLELGLNKKDKVIKMDRTSILDFVKKAVDEQTLLLPADAERIPDYYSQMTSSTRVLEVNEAHIEKSRYVWRHTKPDHYLLAEAYCMQADMLIPNSTFLDYYMAEVKRMRDMDKSIDQILPKLDETPVEELQSVDRAQFMRQKDKAYTVQPSVMRSSSDVESELVRVANDLLKQKGKFTLDEFGRASGLRGEKGREYLLNHGFVETGEVFVKEVHRDAQQEETDVPPLS